LGSAVNLSQLPSQSRFTGNDHNSSSGDNKKIRAHLLINGKVQGVYFRQNAVIVAARNNVKGWVRNLQDGQVEVLLEGSQSDVGQVIRWCNTGPTNAKVISVDVKYEKYVGEFEEFKISY
jgi:acylphosphatase